MGKDPDAIRDEVRIVWTEDVSALDYVRETLSVDAGTRRGPVPWRGHGRRVGYSVLRADAPSGIAPGKFSRRVFWIKDHDRSEQPNGIYQTAAPSEAIDPRTVSPGVWGEITERAWGGPLPAVKPQAPAKRPASKSPAQRPGATSSPLPTKVDGDQLPVHQGVTKAFADWLYLHDVSVPGTIGAAVEATFARWLSENSEQLVTAIAEAVAKSTRLPGVPPPNAEG
jgi:hypothetical protein